MEYSNITADDFIRTTNSSDNDKTSKKFDLTLLVKKNESYSILGEAYIAKDLCTQPNIKIGRQN